MHRCTLFLAIALSAGSLLAQNPARVKAAALHERLQQNDTLYIVNFWATWCPPCVAELPDFSRIDSAWQGKPLKVLLVSLDFPEAWPEKLNEFLKKRHISPQVLWLDESDANYYIPLINPNWSGALPATLISCRSAHTSEFHEGKVNAEFLNGKIKTILKQP